MATTSILIIDSLGDCSMSAVRALMPEGFGIVAAATWDRGRQLLAENRPALVLADCRVTPDPLAWVEEIHQLELPAQVIALADGPDFERSMDWVAGGVFSVLSRPLDEGRLRRLALAALETHEAFQALTERPDLILGPPLAAPGPDLKNFYQGLAGRLEVGELKSYLAESVKNLTGARRVDLCLEECLVDTARGLDTRTPGREPGRFLHDPDLPPAPVSGQATVKCRLGFALADGRTPLGEMYLYFENKSDLKIRRRETMLEIVAAAGAALGAAARYRKAVNLASRDSLTGLHNRRVFDETLEREFAQAQRHNYHLSLLSLDLDHFKSVNDTFGHQTGDLVLRAVARIINQVARTTDLPARIGGEEFAVILPHTTQTQAYFLAERLRQALAAGDYTLAGTVFRPTVSQGVAGLEHFMVKSPEDMVYWADQAMYLAKREGRDTIRLASELSMTPMLKDGPYAFQ